MKTIKKMAWCAALAFGALQAAAQTKSASDPADVYVEHNSYDIIHSRNGNPVEEMQIWLHGVVYKAGLKNNNLTALHVNGRAIPESGWSKYAGEIAAIKEQIKQNRIQAKKNEEQAKLNEIQAKKNQEQVARNEVQANLNQEQEEKNQAQVERNRQQEKLNEIQAQKNEAQAKVNQEQQERNKEQAVRNEEQAKRNEEQAVKNKAQAEANERFIRSITSDLVADKIIPNDKGLNQLTLNSGEMIVNGVKQPDSVHKKYADKYQSTANGSFSFSNDGEIPGKN